MFPSQPVEVQLSECRGDGGESVMGEPKHAKELLRWLSPRCQCFPWAQGEMRPSATIRPDYWISHNTTSKNHQLRKKTPSKGKIWAASERWTGSRTHHSAWKLCCCCQHLPQMFITASVLKSSPSIHTGDLNCEDSSTQTTLGPDTRAAIKTKLLASEQHGASRN